MRNKHRGTGFLLLGVVLIAAAAALTLSNLRDEQQAAQRAGQALEQIRQELPDEPALSAPTADELPDAAETEIPNYILNPEMDMPVQTVDGLDYIGILEIPALGRTLPVISQWSESAAKSAPCRYAGSAYTGDLIIAGHNYRSHFAGLKTIPEGSVIRFTDTQGNRFEYEVVLVETLHAADVEEMQSGGWALSLFTCTLSGQYRATVRCRSAAEPIENVRD